MTDSKYGDDINIAEDATQEVGEVADEVAEGIQDAGEEVVERGKEAGRALKRNWENVSDDDDLMEEDGVDFELDEE